MIKKILFLSIFLTPLFAIGQAPTSDSTKLVAPPTITGFTPSSWYQRGGNASNAQIGFFNNINNKWFQVVTGYQFNKYALRWVDTLSGGKIPSRYELKDYVKYNSITGNLDLRPFDLSANNVTTTHNVTVGGYLDIGPPQGGIEIGNPLGYIKANDPNAVEAYALGSTALQSQWILYNTNGNDGMGTYQYGMNFNRTPGSEAFTFGKFPTYNWFRIDKNGIYANGSKIATDSTAIAKADSVNNLYKYAKNAKSFGVKGDTVTVDNTAIQAFLNLGGVLYFPPGIYLVNGNIPLQPVSNSTILLDPAATIQVAPTSSAFTYSAIYLNQVSNVSISGGGKIIGDRLTHTGSTGEHGFGLSVYGSDNINISNITVRKCWGDGIYIGGDTTGMTVQATHIQVNNAVCDSNRRIGLTITHAKDVTINGGKFTNNGGTAPNAGIDIEPNDQQNVQGVVIDGVLADKNGFAGIQSAINGTSYISDVKIINNRVINNGSYGIRPISIRQGLILTNNYVSDNATLTNNSYAGISIEGTTADAIVTNNDIKAGILNANKIRYGIQFLGTTSKNSVFGNDVLNSGLTGQFNDAGTSNSIFNNKIDSLTNASSIGNKAVATANNQMKFGDGNVTTNTFSGAITAGSTAVTGNAKSASLTLTGISTGAVTDSLLNKTNSNVITKIPASYYTGIANTFTPLQNFNGGLTVSGATYNDISTAFNTTSVAPLIYGTAATGSVTPFLTAGNLVLQSRPVATRGIYMVTGGTPSIKGIFDDSGLTLPLFTNVNGIVYNSNSSGLLAVTAQGASGTVLHGGGATAPAFGQVVGADMAAQTITYSKLQVGTTNKLYGTASGTTFAEVTLGTGLSFTGSTLNVTGFASAANPTALAGKSAVPGSATTFQRSDAAPAIDTTSTGFVTVSGVNSKIAPYFSRLSTDNTFGGTNTAKNFYSTSAAPTATVGGAAGTGATISIVGTNQDGVITLNTGTGATNGTLFTVTMSGSFSYPTSCTPILTQSGGTILGTPPNIGVTAQNGTTFTIGVNGGILSSTTLIWNYHNGGY